MVGWFGVGEGWGREGLSRFCKKRKGKYIYRLSSRTSLLKLARRLTVQRVQMQMHSQRGIVDSRIDGLKKIKMVESGLYSWQVSVMAESEVNG
jgi:hypothetical protein